MMTILTVPLGLALGLTFLPSATPPVGASLLAAGTLWQKPETAPPEPSGTGEPKAPREPKKPPRKHTPAAGSTSKGPAKSTDTLEKEVFGGGGEPAARRKPSAHKRRHVIRKDDDDESDDNADDDSDDEADDDEGGDDLRAASQPVIAPRLVSLGVGTALMGRSFSFNTALQKENTLPTRPGVALDLESFPFLGAEGWLTGLGVGGSFDTEFGSAGVTQSGGGVLSYPVTEQRWSADLRYDFPLGRSFMVVPLVGFGHSSYDVQRTTQVAPSACGNTSTQVCLPDVSLSHLTAGFSARIALGSTIGVSLGAAYLLGFGIDKGAGQIGSEASASAHGYSGELALFWQLKDWLAVRAAAPLVHYSYSFTGAVAYRSASETYYGATLGATIFVK